MKINFVFTLKTFLIAFIILIAFGCAGKTNLLKEGFFEVEKNSPSGIRFSNVKVYEEESGLYVEGKLNRTFVRTSYPGHVDIALIAPDGEIIEATSVKNKLPFIGRSKRTTSSYKALFRSIPPEGSTIRVVFHRKEFNNTSQFDCGSNQAAQD
jgi:hypothetical protein